MPNIGPLEIVVVLIIALVVFGPKRLPELGKSMGRGIREFRSTISGKDDESKPELDPPADGAGERVDGEVIGHSAP
jgi:sec-independent protein translocase protein TatA